MKLLTSVFPRNGRVLPAGGWFTLAVCAFVIGLEVAGRYATSDIHDAVAASALLAAGCMIAVRHRRDPLPWLNRLTAFGRRVASSFAWLRYDHGIDLRGTPPLPRRTPPVVFLLALVLVAWGGLAAAAWIAFPTGWRAVSFYSSYTLYLAFMLALWSALLLVTIVGIFVPVAVLDKWLKRWLGDTDRRGAELAAIVGYAVAVSAVAWVVPPAAVLGLCLLVVVGAWIAYLPRGYDGAALLWRSSVDKPACAVPLRRAGGHRRADGPDRVRHPPHGVRRKAVRRAARRRRDALDRAARHGSRVDDAGAARGRAGEAVLRTPKRPRAAHRADAARFRCGRNCRGPSGFARAKVGLDRSPRADPRVPGQVPVEIVEQAHSEATEFDPRWPLKVSCADLEAGAVKERLDRRDEIKTRRQLFRGLQKLFKRASVFKGPAGGGFWLAPHWWFVEGVGREDADAASEDAPPLVGPAYSRILTARARQHAHAVLRATQVDMIFVEDGVTFRNLERALRVLTELYDVHGGKRRAEELHFRGIPKVKVMIHEYEPGNPFRSDLYPEPKFDDLSRVRVLHIFRDRGGHEELIDPPFDFSSTPAPVGALG